MPRPTDQFIQDTLQRLLLVPFESQHSDHTILLRVDRRTYNEAQHLLAELEPGGATHKPLTRAESEALGALRMATERAQVVADTPCTCLAGLSEHAFGAAHRPYCDKLHTD